MTPNQLRQAYLDFFEAQKHVVVPSSPLTPENDPTTLFTGSGMQPMMPYLLGESHPLGTRLVDSQKCFRSQDIEEVGDNRHTTFFEMLGNWSLGDYFKDEQLTWFFSFLTDKVGLEPERLFVTVFRGLPELKIPRDDEAVAIWQKLFKSKGIEATAVDMAERDGMQDGRIFFYDEKKNWWSRTGTPDKMPMGEPGGPDSEVFYDFGADLRLHETSPFKDEPCHVNCDCGRFLEIGNNVFMTYKRTESGFELLKQKNIDFGGGFERILAAQNNDPDVFKTELFQPGIKKIEELSNKVYGINNEDTRYFRIILDHIRASIFLAADGIYPSNKAQGYFQRRLIRRAMIYADKLGINQNFLKELVIVFSKVYEKSYPDIKLNLNKIADILNLEEIKFKKTLSKGMRELNEYWKKISDSAGWLNGMEDSAKEAFNFYQTWGLPIDVYLDVGEEYFGINPLWYESFRFNEKSLREVLSDEFIKLKEEHAELSRSASSGMFKGGLADHSEQTTRYHTATHLIHAALRKILGTHVQQKGSNITVERLRFDFSHPNALTAEELKQVEAQVNEWIKQDLPMTKQTLEKQEALKSGAIAFFVEKYPDQVTVYTIGKDPQTDWISKEFCGGPHVTHTGEIGQIKLIKEQAVSAGVRRLYAQ